MKSVAQICTRNDTKSLLSMGRKGWDREVSLVNEIGRWCISASVETALSRKLTLRGLYTYTCGSRREKSEKSRKWKKLASERNWENERRGEVLRFWKVRERHRERRGDRKKTWEGDEKWLNLSETDREIATNENGSCFWMRVRACSAWIKCKYGSTTPEIVRVSFVWLIIVVCS